MHGKINESLVLKLIHEEKMKKIFNYKFKLAVILTCTFYPIVEKQ